MHNMHHEHIHYNFALYFTFWDRWMGTMHPDYEEVLEELTAQPYLQRPKATKAA
jgi:sterol desaturase/sphingolipid hydroxylase (fatty acid hydroxylase superfamily)